MGRIKFIPNFIKKKKALGQNIYGGGFQAIAFITGPIPNIQGIVQAVPIREIISQDKKPGSVDTQPTIPFYSGPRIYDLIRDRRKGKAEFSTGCIPAVNKENIIFVSSAQITIPIS